MLEIKKYISNSEEDTFEIGRQLGSQAKKKEVYAMYADMGMGKTAFAKGFAKGLGVNENVNSPTFTILKEYHSGRIPFYHFDVYRIGDIDEMNEIGYCDYFYGDGVCLIEWADLIEEILPEDCKRIKITSDARQLNNRTIILDKGGKP